MEGRERANPWVRNLILLVGFVVLVAIGIFTVLLPELEEEPAETSTGSRDPDPASEPAQ